MVRVTSSKVMAEFIQFVINIMVVWDSNICPEDLWFSSAPAGKC
jgi:hypothetical protein